MAELGQAKNRAPADIQITAEQLLREARDRTTEEENRQKSKLDEQQLRLRTPEELNVYQLHQRKDYEERLRNTLHNISNYLKYAKWEESQLEYRRARSIYERAIEIDYRNYITWIKYGEFELRNKFVNHARNVWNRAITLLPRVSQLWYKYAHMEEVLGEADNVRTIFERWLKWEPEVQAWYSYINFEDRCNNILRARDLYERFCGTFPRSASYLKYAAWEEKNKELALARKVYERAFVEIPENTKLHDKIFPTLFLKFAAFEIRCKVLARAKAIYQAGHKTLSKARSKPITEAYLNFEKQYGEAKGVNILLLAKFRLEYEKMLRRDAYQYDFWIDYIRLEENYTVNELTEYMKRKEMVELMNSQADEASFSDASLYSAELLKLIKDGRDRCRDLYERAIACVPKTIYVKDTWRRYIFLWIYYAVFEEVIVKDKDRAKMIYKKLLYKVLHPNILGNDRSVSGVYFTFSKVWIRYTELLLRQKNVKEARRVLGEAIAVSQQLKYPKKQIFVFYLKLEKRLGDVARIRKVFEKYIESFSHLAETWLDYIKFESQLKESERCRALFNAALDFSSKSSVEGVDEIWKEYINFETNEKQYANVVAIYKKLLKVHKHVKIYANLGKFYALQTNQHENARQVFELGDEYIRMKIANLKTVGNYSSNTIEDDILDEATENVLKAKEDRRILLTRWINIEEKIKPCDVNQVAKIKALLPEKLKRRKFLENPEGETETEQYVEFYELMFPEEQQQQKGMKFLAFAQKWKTGKLKAPEEAVSSDKPTDTNEIELEL